MLEFPKGPCAIYSGPKVVPIWVLWGHSIYYLHTCTPRNCSISPYGYFGAIVYTIYIHMDP